MKRPMRAEPVLIRAATLTALFLSAAPALAQSDAMPLPGGVHASSPPNLTVDPGLWSLTTTESQKAVLTFNHYPNATEVAAVESSGAEAHPYRTLPMLAVQGTGLQLRSLLGFPGLRSIYLDRRLDDSLIGANAADLVLGQAAERGAVAVIGSSGTGLLALGGNENGPAVGSSAVGADSSGPLFVVTALEGFDWVFQNRMKYGIETIAGSWGGSGELSPDDPISVASKVAHDAGLVLVFAENGERAPTP
jgi:serine protease AprX